MTNAAIEVALILGMSLSAFGCLGVANGILVAIAVTTGTRIRWYWHLVAWLICFLALVFTVHYGTVVGLWTLNGSYPAAGGC